MSLVVKNGLKIRSLRSAGTPGPSSATSTTTVGVGGCVAGERRVRLDRARAPRVIVMRALAVERLERVGDQVGEHLAQLMVIALDHRQARRARPASTVDVAARRLRSRPACTACCSTSARSVRSTCSRTGRTNSSISTTIALASFASLMMSASSDCASVESGTWRRSSRPSPRCRRAGSSARARCRRPSRRATPADRAAARAPRAARPASGP